MKSNRKDAFQPGSSCESCQNQVFFLPAIALTTAGVVNFWFRVPPGIAVIRSKKKKKLWA
jgi:hypothetical protein